MRSLGDGFVDFMSFYCGLRVQENGLKLLLFSSRREEDVIGSDSSRFPQESWANSGSFCVDSCMDLFLV